MWDRVDQVLESRVRPHMALHNGGVELLGVDSGVVHIRPLGQCSNCPASYITTEQLILSELSQAVPEITQVVADHSVSENLLAQARKLMGRHHG